LTTVFTVIALRAQALGGDYRNDQHVDNPSWPKGMAALVNTTNRIGGLWVNAEDTFFFAGSKTNFTLFLEDYSKIAGIKPRLILHAGAGEAFDLGGGNRRPCDWSVHGGSAAWINLHAGVKPNTNDINFVLEVNFWTGGKIPFDRASVPTNIEIKVEMPPAGGGN
jgi:hypothetical protein